MIATKPAHRLIALALFAVLMFVTRSHHIATPLHLPDASVALFFLGGMLMQRRLGYMAVMMLGAGLIDYWAINYNGVSSFCISSAYLMMVPAYALLWFGGDWVARRGEAGKALGLPMAGSLLATAFGANLITSGSFYLMSGRFSEPSLMVFLERLQQYAPTYVGYAAMYVVIATLGYLAFAPQRGQALLRGQA